MLELLDELAAALLLDQADELTHAVLDEMPAELALPAEIDAAKLETCPPVDDDEPPATDEAKLDDPASERLPPEDWLESTEAETVPPDPSAEDDDTPS